MRDPVSILRQLEPILLRAAELAGKPTNEAQTRLEVVDDTLVALGWPKQDFCPEARTESSRYTDYLLKSHTEPLLVVEAKRIDQTFHLLSKYTRGRYQNKFLVNNCGEELREAMEQAASYCNQTGCTYAAVTNGLQWIFFRGLALQKSPWTHFEAVVFNGAQEIQSRFSEFLNLMSREAVVAGSLAEVLRVSDAPLPPFIGRPTSNLEPTHLFPPVPQRDSLVLFQHFFDDMVDVDGGHMLEQCFVSDSTLNEYEKDLQAVLQEQRLGLKDAEPQELCEQALSELISSPDTERRGRVVLVVGRVGAGKTTFIHRFFAQKEREQGYARFILDLRTQAQSAVDPTRDEITRLAKLILNDISERYHARKGFGAEYDPYDGNTLRTIYAAKVSQLQRGPKRNLYGKNKNLLEQDIAELLTEISKDPIDLLPNFMRHITKRTGKLFCLVFDNVDRASEKYQQLVYGYAQDLARRMEGIVILSLRDATFERSKRHGFLDTTNSDIVFQLHPPNLKQVISRRIRYIRREAASPRYTPNQLRPDLASVAYHAEQLKELLLGTDQSGLRLLTCLANRSVRRAFFLLRRYFTARTAFGEPAAATAGQQLLHVLLFASNQAYQEANSDILNILSVPPDRLGNYTLSLRLLAYLDWANRVEPSLRAYVLTESILRDFESWGFPRTLVAPSLSRLVSTGLVECDQWFVDYPDESAGRRAPYSYEIDYSHRLSLSPSGYFYLHDALNDPLYALCCAADSFWYDESAYTKFSKELMEVFKSAAPKLRDRLELFLASECHDIWKEYLEKQLTRESETLAQSADIAWRRHIDNFLEQFKLTAISDRSDRRARVPRKNAEQLPLFEPAVIRPSLGVIATNMPPLSEHSELHDSRQIPRILWALELASRAELGGLTASQLAQLLTDYAGVKMSPNNVARLFRTYKNSTAVACLWNAQTVGGRSRYVLSSAGSTAVELLWKDSSHKPTADGTPRRTA